MQVCLVVAVQNRCSSLASPEVCSLAPFEGQEPPSPSLQNRGRKLPGKLVEPIFSPDCHLSCIFDFACDGTHFGQKGVGVFGSDCDQSISEEWGRNHINISMVRSVQLNVSGPQDGW